MNVRAQADPSLYPLIPANAGTQIKDHDDLAKSLTWVEQSPTIWIPAFAGMSGME